MSIDGIKGLDFKIPSPFDVKKANNEENSTIPFVEYLNDELNKTNDMLLEADRISEDFASGKTDNIHQVLIASEQANIALQFTLQVRNKIMDAYNEIMRMQI